MNNAGPANVKQKRKEETTQRIGEVKHFACRNQHPKNKNTPVAAAAPTPDVVGVGTGWPRALKAP